MSETSTVRVAPEEVRQALSAADELRHYHIAALDDLLESCRRFAGEELLNVAILAF